MLIVLMKKNLILYLIFIYKSHGYGARNHDVYAGSGDVQTGGANLVFCVARPSGASMVDCVCDL